MYVAPIALLSIKDVKRFKKVLYNLCQLFYEMNEAIVMLPVLGTLSKYIEIQLWKSRPFKYDSKNLVQIIHWENELKYNREGFLWLLTFKG